MRIPIVYSNGHFLSGFDCDTAPEVALGHAVRSLREFAISVDGVQETSHRITEAGLALEDQFQSASASADAEFRFLVRYWQERQLHHAKAGVISLSQVRDGLFDFERLTSLQAAKTALTNFAAKFADITNLRDSVAHANERARWKARAQRGKQANAPINLAVGADPKTGAIMYSDVLSALGTIESNRLEFRIQRDGNAATASLDFSDQSIADAHAVLQRLVDGLSWRATHERRQPFSEFLMDLG